MIVAKLSASARYREALDEALCFGFMPNRKRPANGGSLS
jgi:hypothetical protein